jgi:hypothetical protein
MGARAITTITVAKTWVPATQGVDDVSLQRCLDAASIMIEQMCNRRFVSTQYTARHSGSKAYGTCGDKLVLCDQATLLMTPGVTAIGTLKEDGASLATSLSTTDPLVNGEYAVYDAMSPILKRASVSGNMPYPTGWSAGTGNIYIAYTAGYAIGSMPEDIVQAAVELTWSIYFEGPRAGMASRQATTGSASFSRNLGQAAQAAIEHHTMFPETRTLYL